MKLNLKNIYAKLEEEGLDALLVSSPANISYLTDYISRDSLLLVLPKNKFYITDSRYIEEAKVNLSRSFQVIKTNGSNLKTIAEIAEDLKIKTLGFEERNFSFSEHQRLKKSLKRVKLRPTYGLIEDLRELKREDEIKKIKKATSIAVETMRFIKKIIKPQVKEIEVAAEAERFIRYKGASNSAFDIIVASGPNSSFAHHLTSGRKIRKDEVVLVDLGVDYQGYKSDLTRVFFLGKINPVARSIYDIVLAAQKKAISRIRPQVGIDQIDKAARQYISEKKYGGFFGHNLGHGIGLEIHEAPTISGRNTNRLEPGMVFTVEPAIYLPHEFGLRIEDIVLVTKKGAEVLSGSLDK